MFLLVWSSERSRDCAKALELAFQQPVQTVHDFEQACEKLKSNSFAAVLVDQSFCENAPGQADFLFQHLGAAIPVVVNFAISGVDRVVRTTRAALEHRVRETLLARQNARSVLRSELKDDVTALLLSCGIASHEPGLTEAAAQRLKQIEEIANEIRRKLLAADENQTSAAHA
jgi:hypothetical protein